MVLLTALAGIVGVDAVERVVPGAVARAVHEDSAAGRGAPYTTPGWMTTRSSGLRPRDAHDGEVSHGLLGDEVAVVAGSAGLNGFGGRLYLHCVGDGADFEFDVDVVGCPM